MVYELTPEDLNYYHFKKPLLDLIAAIRARGHLHDDITLTIETNQPLGGSYALSYTDKGKTHHEK